MTIFLCHPVIEVKCEFYLECWSAKLNAFGFPWEKVGQERQRCPSIAARKSDPDERSGWRPNFEPYCRERKSVTVLSLQAN